MGGQTVARLKNGVATYPHSDHLGSAAAATDASGNLLWREDYTPFGEPRQNPAGNADDEGFIGHIHDQATGLTYMQARYYDPVIGRFLSNDPVGFAQGGPGYFNRYAYTANDPVNHTDPTGMAACPGICGMARADSSFSQQRGAVTSAASAQLDKAHFALDGVGLFPGAGIFADGANAALYTARGDLGNAGISLGAMVPVVGQAVGGARLGAKTADAAYGALSDGMSMGTDDALDAAIDVLGDDYSEIAEGVFRSADGQFQVRMTQNSDLAGRGTGGTPHMNFERGSTNQLPGGRNRFDVDENKHILLPEEQ